MVKQEPTPAQSGDVETQEASSTSVAHALARDVAARAKTDLSQGVNPTRGGPLLFVRVVTPVHQGVSPSGVGDVAGRALRRMSLYVTDHLAHVLLVSLGEVGLLGT